MRRGKTWMLPISLSHSYSRRPSPHPPAITATPFTASNGFSVKRLTAAWDGLEYVKVQKASIRDRIIVFIFFRKNKQVYIPFSIGLVFHILLDLPEGIPLFYPFVYANMNSSGSHIGFFETLIYFIDMMFNKQFVLISEACCVVLINNYFVISKKKILCDIDMIEIYVLG